jgi:hypothetical protein
VKHKFDLFINKTAEAIVKEQLLELKNKVSEQAQQILVYQRNEEHKQYSLRMIKDDLERKNNKFRYDLDLEQVVLKSELQKSR